MDALIDTVRALGQHVGADVHELGSTTTTLQGTNAKQPHCSWSFGCRHRHQHQRIGAVGERLHTLVDFAPEVQDWHVSGRNVLALQFWWKVNKGHAAWLQAGTVLPISGPHTWLWSSATW